jgi:hypothetical protein
MLPRARGTLALMPDPEEEINQLYERCEAQKKAAAELKAEMLSLERRMLLRFRGRQFCRLCISRTARPGEPIDPPASESEKTFCDGNHGEFLQKDISRRIPELALPVTWEQLEEIAAALRKP